MSNPEQTAVLIVGAGPTGLTLALTLAKHKIHTIILEKEAEVCQDPRGVVLSGDAVRIAFSLGIRDGLLTSLGHQAPSFSFHEGSLGATPFLSIDMTPDLLCQLVPPIVFMNQPRLESALRAQIAASHYADLRTSATVTAITQTEDAVTATYSSPDGSSHAISSRYLVGADGKRGFVRKHHLQPQAGITQRAPPDYAYECPWLAANLRVTLPTPSTHPAFPAWKLGMTPADVEELFWPPGFHFTCPPGCPAAFGRVGALPDRLWRYECELLPSDTDLDPRDLLEETLPALCARTLPEGGTLEFPRDCVYAQDVRIYRFAHAVVDRWFSGRVALAGDAAHVFPPFGGQGIACGARDAHQLALRLAVLVNSEQESHEGHHSVLRREAMLDAWAKERVEGVRQALVITRGNGDVCCGRIAKADLDKTTAQGRPPTVAIEEAGFTTVKGGFFDPTEGRRGGMRCAQVFVVDSKGDESMSDQVLERPGLVSIVVLGDAGDMKRAMGIAEAAVEDVGLPRWLLRREGVVGISPGGVPEHGARYYAVTENPRQTDVPKGYEPGAFYRRFGEGTRFVLIRADWVIFGTAKDKSELLDCLKQLGAMCRL